MRPERSNVYRFPVMIPPPRVVPGRRIHRLVRWVKVFGWSFALYDDRRWLPFSIRMGYVRSYKLGHWHLTVARKP